MLLTVAGSPPNSWTRPLVEVTPERHSASDLSELVSAPVSGTKTSGLASCARETSGRLLAKSAAVRIRRATSLAAAADSCFRQVL